MTTNTDNDRISLATGMKTIETKMKFRAVMMTPTVAAELLKNRHPRQRNPKKGRIALYSSDMLCGFWKLTHQAVAVDEDGYLIDGQNRLEAIIIADKAVPVLLITGVPRDAMVALDNGMNRNVADAAKVLGREFKRGANSYAAVARQIMVGLKWHKGSISNQEVLNFIDVHRKAIDFAFDAINKDERFITSAQVRAVVARAYYRRPVDETRARLLEFGEVYLSGLPENPKADSAAIRLRNWLIENFGARKGGAARARPKATTVYAKAEIAVQHFLDRQEVKYLQDTSKELFPIPNDPVEDDDEE